MTATVRTTRSGLQFGWLCLSLLTACIPEDHGNASSGTGGSAPGAGGATPSATGGVTGSTGGALPSGAMAGNMGGAGDGTPTGGLGAADAGGGVAGTGGALNMTGGAAGTGGMVDWTGGAVATGGLVDITGGTAGAGAVDSTGGASGTGGSPGGATTCGTAAEGQSTTLTCPEGQIIDSVVFASYGTPTGDCGSYAMGDCHATSSEATLSSLCVGRDACTVPASNSAFGDPCNSVEKNLAVEVACVEGEPTVGEGPYKGVANSPAAEIAALGATWCYNWETGPKVSDCGDPLFVPMIWGAGDVAGAIQAIGNAGYDTVLGFNEPNKSEQANMTVQEAIELWPDMTSDPSIRVGSPAVSDDGRAWLEDFMAEVQAEGLRVDFIAMHWYGWNAGSCVPGQLEGAVNWASQWGLPVWITEFGCMGSSNSDEQTLLSFFDGAIAMLDNHPAVDRYAWYPWNTYNHLFLENSQGVREITALGQAFAAAPQYR